MQVARELTALRCRALTRQDLTSQAEHTNAARVKTLVGDRIQAIDHVIKTGTVDKRILEKWRDG